MKSRVERRLAAILCADVVGYSRLIERDEAGTLRALRSLRREVVDPLLANHGGRVVQVAGDGALIEFGSVVDAVQCAAAVQQAVAAHQAAAPPECRLVFRIGINLGDVVADGTDTLGDGVNVAARLEQLCEPGGVLISETVREHVGNRLDIAFEDLGPKTLKNIDRPVRVHRLLLYDKQPQSVVADPWPARADRSKPSVAVLPFVNMSGDAEQEYFSDGISEDLITDLSKVSGLFVLARNSTFAFKGKQIDVRELSRRLNVGYVLEGSVRKAGARIRISAQLIDGEHGGHVWAERFDRELTDIFAVQDEITSSIIASLRVRLLSTDQKRLSFQQTNNVEAYQLYLQGRHFFYRHDRRSYAIAKQLFEQARIIDPTFARAHSAIADCDAFLYLYFKSGVSQDMIMANATRALELEPDLPAAHASLGLALQVQGHLSEAEREFETSIRLDPNLFEGWYFYARLRFIQGRLEDCARLFEHAADVNPEDYQALGLLGQIYTSLGRPPLARSAAERGLERTERELERAPENARAAYFRAGFLIDLGEPDQAREWLSRAIAIEPDDILTLYNVACLHSLLGDLDRAVELLADALPRAHGAMKTWIANDSDLDPLRQHPRFQSLLHRINTQP